jgi:hypothetical protein
MELSTLLENNRPAILKKWLDEIFDTYPADTSRFLKGGQDRFANPVGHTITANAEFILEGLAKGSDTQSLTACLEDIIRIRAVQDFTPSEAVSFMAKLKTVIAGQLKTEINKYNLLDDWAEFETRIDSLTQCAYELHAEMKKRIDFIRTREIDKGEKFLARLMESRVTCPRDGSSDPSAFSGCT